MGMWHSAASHKKSKIDLTAKYAKDAKENQNLNHRGTRKEIQGHEAKKQRKFFAAKIFKVSNAEAAERKLDRYL
jgi:hypothetical protein